MKENMKKLLALLCMAVLVLGLTACSSDEAAVDEGPALEEEYMSSLADFVVSNMTMMGNENMQYYVDMDAEDMQEVLDGSGIPIEAEAFQDIFSSYMSSTEDLGAYISTDSHEVSVSDEETTQVTYMTFETHPATMTMVFDADGIVTSTALDITYSMGEILEKAALNTVLGMGTVFAVLIFISFVIALLPYVTKAIEGKEKKTEEAVSAAASVAAPAAEEELADDLELVAVISAAIAAYEGTSSDGFVVRSIRRSGANKWKRA